jgi:high-affinity iron transporter
MFLNSVILILQEILEAALLISVLLVFSKRYGMKPHWLFAALGLGGIGAFLFAINMAEISEWFDYVGQEVANALIQFSIMFFLGIFTALLPKKSFLFTENPYALNGDSNRHQPQSGRAIITLMLLIVSLALTREGSEVFIYIGGVIGHPSHIQPTLTGAGIGTGIGLSAGVLIYYGLLGLPHRWVNLGGLVLLSLVSGNMASQATLLLTQADWFPYSQILWDSSNLLPENSILGHLLYALIGYEATPSLFQGISYVCGILLIFLCSLLQRSKITSITQHKTPSAKINVRS